MTIKKHTHRLKRHNHKNGERVFFCVLDDCHYKIIVEMSLGKTAECWRCKKPFTINEYSIRLARPHCNDYTEREVGEKETTKFKVVIPPRSSSIDELKARLQKVVGTNDLEEDML